VDVSYAQKVFARGKSTVMITVYQKDTVGFSDFFPQVITLMRQRRCIDNGARDTVGRSKRRRKGYWRQDRLNSVGNEYVLDQGCNET